MHYQPFGPLTSLGYGNGLSRTINFDNDARITSILTNNPAAGTTQQSLTFTWSANDVITGIANARNTALTQSFTYDELGRITGAGRGDGVAEGFAYDVAGNRTAYTKAGLPRRQATPPRAISFLLPAVHLWSGSGLTMAAATATGLREATA
jgi:YD repeat-containing protein